MRAFLPRVRSTRKWPRPRPSWDDMASLFLTKQASLSEILKQGKELIKALDE